MKVSCIYLNSAPYVKNKVSDKTSNILFRGSYIPDGFSRSDVEAINKMMAPENYRYGRDLQEIMKPENDFYCQINPNGIILYNISFIKPKTKQKRGECSELAVQAALELNQHFKDKYRFAIVSGTSPEFFNKEYSAHDFVLAWAKKYDNKINQFIGEKIYPLALQNGIDPSYFALSDIPHECLVIDPSFNYSGSADKGYKFRYHQFLVTPKSDIRYIKNGSLFFHNKSSDEIVLGFLEQGGNSDKKVVSLMFNKDHYNHVYPCLKLGDKAGNISIIDFELPKFLNKFKPDDPFRRFMEKITYSAAKYNESIIIGTRANSGI